MKLKHSFFTIILISFLIILLILCVLCLFGKNIFNKNYLYKAVEYVDVISFIKDDKELNEMLKNKKIPKEIFEYIDDNKVKEIKKKIIDGFYTNKSSIIEPTEIKMILKDSINFYESKYTLDIYNNIEKEIQSFSIKITNNINDYNFISSFRTIDKIVNGVTFYILIAILITIIIFISILERKNSLFILGIIFFISSLVIYYVSNQMLTILSKNKLIIDYVSQKFLIEISNIIKPIYIVFFLLGIVLLIVYGMICLKKIIRKIRIYSYDCYYRR